MTSTKTETTETISAKEAARQVLAAAAGPLNIKVICERVLAKENLALKGKTPDATIAAVLHVAAKKGDLFRKTGRGIFELIPTEGTPKATPKAAAPAAEPSDDGHDPRGDVPGTIVVKRGGEAKADPKPSSRKKTKAPVAA